MAKNASPEIDESELLALVSRKPQAYSPPKREQSRSASNSQDDAQESADKEKPVKSPKKQKSDDKNYEEVFLVKKPNTERCQTYIDRDTYFLLKRILPAIAPDISIAAYINNIIDDHLDEYWDKINGMFESAQAKPLKRK